MLDAPLPEEPHDPSPLVVAPTSLPPFDIRISRPVGCTPSCTVRPGSSSSSARWLRIERGVATQDVSNSGYWRIGVNDEGWRAAERDWLAGAEAAERAVGVA